jgi:hypothetical protein
VAVPVRLAGIPGVAAATETQGQCRPSMEEALTFYWKGLTEQVVSELFREAAQQKDTR